MTPPRQPLRQPSHAAVIYRRGETWDPRRPFREQDEIGLHAVFLRDQQANGNLYCGGPFLDDLGGLAIYNVLTDVRSLEVILETDPTIRRGTMTFEIHPLALTFEPPPPT
jgi:uncharacterized protein YciI